MKLCCGFSLLALFTFILPSPATSPANGQGLKVHDSRLKIELFAKQPDIVTPIGVTFDRKGRLLVIESHTHQREKNYKGPAKDRIRIVEDTDGDGRGDRFRTFFEGTEATMSLARGPGDWIYVATRMKVFRLRDTDGDDRADQEQLIAHLDTRGNYPHNGLSGLALDGRGQVYFGMGENLGAKYRLLGSDGAAQRGSGEGGVFRCDLEGKKLTRIATGFWNPFGICVDPHQRIFAVGNDADGRPPCRLVQIVESGDYGYQYRYGRSGRHPLQAWDGELPGTLPMMAGTGEGPCEIAVYHGRLYVASWGDNRIERYELQPVGASFHARRETVIQGDKSFRPVGFARSPDGSLYVTDWADKSYPVHGKGRIWRLSFKSAPGKAKLPPLSKMEERALLATTKADWEAFRSDNVFLRQAAVAGLVHSSELRAAEFSTLKDARQRLGLLQALRWKLDHSRGKPAPAPQALLKQALTDSDADVRLYAVRWVADAAVKPLRSAVEAQLNKFAASTPELFQASVAALELLDTGRSSFDAKNAARYFVRALADPSKPAKLRAMALRMIPPDHDALKAEFLSKLIAGNDPDLRREAVRALAVSTRSDRFAALAAVAKDNKLPESIRADAVVGLATDAKRNLVLLKQLSQQASGEVGLEATGAISRQGGGKTAQHPPATDLESWLSKVGKGGDADAGWRVFFRTDAARCANCHRLQGRGAKTGPDLTAIAARMSRRRVLQSILQPSRDIAPQFVPQIIRTKGGKVLEGLRQGYDEKGLRQRFLAPNGTIFQIDPSQIAASRVSNVSIMPQDLHKQLSLKDIRDLLALLSRDN